MVSSKALVMLNSLPMVASEGATIDDETGEMNVNIDTTNVAAHFLFLLQFLGFSGSSGPSHVTYFVVRKLDYYLVRSGRTMFGSFCS